MTQSGGSWSWSFMLTAALGLGGAMIALSGNCGLAQIKPDTTLGAESSAVKNNVRIKALPSDQIEGGARRGANLFHSFEQFNVDEGRGTYFTNPIGVKNILSRVTGNDPSDILGTLGVTGGNANLFLINPSGITFGPNASLDVNGSFVATTATAIQFDNQGFFNTSEPDAPPLLTVNPSAFLFNQIANAPIKNNSIAPAGFSPSGINVLGLRVPDGQSLLMVGGDVSLESGGRLNALGGRVELGGLAGLGTIGLGINGNTFSLSFTPDSLLSNVTLLDDARVGVRGSVGGDIVVNANTFTATNGGRIVAGSEGAGNAGNITVNANDFSISGIGLSGFGAGLYNQVLAGASGNAGTIVVNTKSFNASSGALLQTETLGQGNAGSVNINALEAVNLADSNISSDVQFEAVGDGGDINIKTGSLSLADGASLYTITVGEGSAGNVNIDARDTVSADGFLSSISSSGFYGVGNGGNINIKTGSLSLTNDASLYTRTSGEGRMGNGGNINIKTGSLSLTNGANLSTDANGQGNAGNVNINARDTVSADGFGSDISSYPYVGNSGDINIKTGSLFFTNGAQLSVTSILGEGNAGNVNINARDTVSFEGFLGGVSSDATNSVSGRGDGGDINIKTRSLSLTNGADLSANTDGEGNAGNVNINARDTVSADGFRSGVFSTVQFGAADKVKGGDINIKTGSLFFTNGAQLSTSTYGAGDAGSVNIIARNIVSFDGQGKNSFPGIHPLNAVFPSSAGSGNGTVEATGNGGTLNIWANSLFLTNGAQLIASTYGQGNAGNVNINAHDVVSLSGRGRYGDGFSGVLSRVKPKAVGDGGDINLTTGSLLMSDGAHLDASTEGQGDAGSMTIDVLDSVSFDRRSRAFSTVEAGAIGNGGNIKITTESLSMTGASQLATGTRGLGDAGNLTINARDTVSFDRGNAFSTVEETGKGKGGDINITTRMLEVTDRSQLVAATRGQGDAGNVKIDAREKVSFGGQSSGSPTGAFSTVEATGKGKGGYIDITTGVLEMDRSQLSASSEGKGPAGNIEVAADSIRLDNQAALGSDSIGGQGNIFLNSQDLLLSRGSNITTNATEEATGGNININTGVLTALENSDIRADSEEAFGGRVLIDAQGIFGTEFREDETEKSDITATSELGPEFSGTVELNTPDVDPSQGIIALPEEVVDVSGLIAQTCPAGSGPRQSKFVMTGRGGVPPNPGETLNTDAVQVDLVTLNPEVDKSSAAAFTSPSRPGSAPMLEAQGWVKDAKGNVVLTAQAPTVNPRSSWQKTANCQKP